MAVLHPFLSKESETVTEELEEAVNLAAALNTTVSWEEKVKLHSIVPSTLFGSGTLQRLGDTIQEKKINLVIINKPITASQQRNLERKWNCKVLDRTGLILAIFASRAKTKEGVLQVELAALMYQKSRLVKSWTHLERQRGGLSFVGGPGEAQLELDRRLLDTRVKKLKKQLEKVNRTRNLQRRARKKVPYPIISLIGYTNAGKSTLFNKLTGATVYVKDQLFATLDPTMRLLKLPSGRKVILSDTVGFISNIPTQLIASFKSTLQDVLESSILLHVIDITAANKKKQYNDVHKVLREINIDLSKKPIIDVYNKVDKENNELSYPLKNTVLVSAATGSGCQDLLDKIDATLEKADEPFILSLPFEATEIASWLHNNASVSFSKYTKDALKIRGHISQKNKGLFKKNFPNIKLL